ncbi:MAG: YbaB/EbfC family nucleoid-associated protein [Clostridia bacterium]|nr:YbaB/EbfC family nucleoid-associated protein [Clostridia bacterium]MBO7503474.1 YbaB/EbfC family nucleoid-associated protein [Clostridia bacterium]MBO7658956.1 YbaB/EbfC family nucleoid-associated protein [Clostridia bacterium]MBR5007027.1 YbaB/EbfC family nucleoid-associated protein [Clostridia bacterium]
MSSGMRGGFGGRPKGGQQGGFNFGGGNMQQMLKQAQKMQSEMQKEQEELNETVFEATSGGGAVKLTMKGDKTLQGIEISPDVVDPDDVEMLQDLIIAAFNDAAAKIDEATHEKMDKYTQAMGV